MNYDESIASFCADPIGAEPDHSRWIETLHDRTLVAIRPMTDQDDVAECGFTEALSSPLRHLRFQGQLVCPLMSLGRQFDATGQGRTLAFAAFIPEGQGESIVGVGSYRTNGDQSSCTCDVAVLDEWHRRGLGSILMRHLIQIAREKGIDYMFGVDSILNSPMIELAGRLGFSQQVNPRDRSQSSTDCGCSLPLHGDHPSSGTRFIPRLEGKRVGFVLAMLARARLLGLSGLETALDPVLARCPSTK